MEGRFCKLFMEFGPGFAVFMVEFGGLLLSWGPDFIAGLISWSKDRVSWVRLFLNFNQASLACWAVE